MNIDENVVESIVKRVVSQLSTETASAQTCPSGGDWGVFESMNDAVDAAVEAQREYLNHSMHDRACYVQAIRDVVLDQENLEYISRLAVEETGMGGYEYKLIKNRLAAVKTPGIEDLTTDAMSGDDGLTLVEYSPFGVIGSITPTTNPTETIICNSIGMLAAGNAVVFSPHPRAKKVSLHLIQLINKALCKAGAPANLVVTVSAPSIENTNAMMSHPKIRMLVATGGPAIVKTVLSSGKKAIGAGAGDNTLLQWFDFVADRTDRLPVLGQGAWLAVWRAVIAVGVACCWCAAGAAACWPVRRWCSACCATWASGASTAGRMRSPPGPHSRRRR